MTDREQDEEKQASAQMLKNVCNDTAREKRRAEKVEAAFAATNEQGKIRAHFLQERDLDTAARLQWLSSALTEAEAAEFVLREDCRSKQDGLNLYEERAQKVEADLAATRQELEQARERERDADAKAKGYSLQLTLKNLALQQAEAALAQSQRRAQEAGALEADALHDLGIMCKVADERMRERDYVERSRQEIAADLVAARAESQALRERLGEAADILQTLLDYQNGPPLPSYEKPWQEVYDRGRAFLAANPAPVEPPKVCADCGKAPADPGVIVCTPCWDVAYKDYKVKPARPAEPEPPKEETETASTTRWQTITADLSPEGQLRALFDEIEAETIAKHGPEEWDRRMAAALAVKVKAPPAWWCPVCWFERGAR